MFALPNYHAVEDQFVPRKDKDCSLVAMCVHIASFYIVINLNDPLQPMSMGRCNNDDNKNQHCECFLHVNTQLRHLRRSLHASSDWPNLIIKISQLWHSSSDVRQPRWPSMLGDADGIVVTDWTVPGCSCLWGFFLEDFPFLFWSFFGAIPSVWAMRKRHVPGRTARERQVFDDKMTKLCFVANTTYIISKLMPVYLTP